MSGSLPQKPSAPLLPGAGTGVCRRVILVGFMGAGKSTVGRQLAELLGWRFRDADEVLAAEQGRSIAEIFSCDGEDHFRALEAATIAALLLEEEAVIALGGGALESEVTRRRLAGLPATCVIHLAVDLDTALARCSGAKVLRPLLADRERLAARFEARQQHYRAAHLEFSSTRQRADQLASGIALALSARGRA